MFKYNYDVKRYNRILNNLLMLTKTCKNNCIHELCKDYILCNKYQDELWMIRFGDL